MTPITEAADYMSNETSTVTEAAPATGAAQPVDLRPSDRRKPTQPVPTERIAFSKQMDLLRAYAAVSGISRRAVSLNDVARVVGMSPATASLANPFFSGINLLLKQDPGFVPSEAVVSYQQQYEWSKETAANALAPVLGNSWAWSAVEGQLRFKPQTESELVRLLATASQASKHYEPNFRIIVTFFEEVGLIERDGNMLRIVKPASGAVEAPARPREEKVNEEGADPAREDEQRNRNTNTSGGGFSGPPTVHPALIGLLQLLPPPRSAWGRGKGDWIKAFTATIDAIYPDDGEAKEG